MNDQLPIHGDIPQPSEKPLLLSPQVEILLPDAADQPMRELIRRAQAKARAHLLNDSHMERAMELYAQCVNVASEQGFSFSSIVVMVWADDKKLRSWRATASFLHFDQGRWQAYRADTGYKSKLGGPPEKAGFLLAEDIYQQGHKYQRARKVRSGVANIKAPDEKLVFIPLESANAGPVKPRAKRASDEPRPKRTKTPEKISLGKLLGEALAANPSRGTYCTPTKEQPNK